MSDLQALTSVNGWGPMEIDMSNGEMAAGDGRIITINGSQYQKGLGVHAYSEVVYDIGGQFSTFISDIGVDDEVGNRGSVNFQVWGDGAKLWESGIVTGASDPETVVVDVAGINTLKLVVTDGYDGDAYDHANWAGARLLK